MEEIDEACELAKKAISFDEKNCIDAAVFFYNEASKLLTQAAEKVDNASSRDTFLKKAQEYKARASLIIKPTAEKKCQTPEQINLNRCKFAILHALDADLANHKDVISLYENAITLANNFKKEFNNPHSGSKLDDFINQAIERVRELEEINSKKTFGTLRAGGPQKQIKRNDSQLLKLSGKETYTIEEKRVLFTTSKINEHEYVPFMSIDLNERFQYAIPFTDKDGPLILSPKQAKEFYRWARPAEICSDPVLIAGTVDCFSIKQTIVSDCSFVASLAVGALYEVRFRKRLITKCIYPKNKHKEPLFNPFGKYMIKFHLNGITRKVIIDDTLPVNEYNQLLSSFSTKKNEMWISLLEKAYMKVMGGYNFPGSNSNIDLHALTGWIPERVAICPNEPTFNSGALFKMLLDEFNKGRVLVTVATGVMSDDDAERAGLIPTHAYAVLDVRDVRGVKLLQLKNPWSHVRWRGNYSYTYKWPQEMCDALKFDPKSAASFDNGVFWIDYQSILKFFDVFYLNWNPEIFSYTSCLHQEWSAAKGPAKDTYNIGDNPQFRLHVGNGTGAVWILLTRHITDIKDFKDNREYITVLVYKNKGKRVYYPHDPPPYLDGVRINSPHYLTKIILASGNETDYTLVISQYIKSVTTYYTLRAYSTCEFKLEKIIDPFIHPPIVKTGEWKGKRAGGCKNHPTYVNNPKYRLNLASYGHLCLDLKAPPQFNIGIDFSSVGDNGFRPTNTGSFRAGFVVLDLENVPPGDYDIVPSTYNPNQESKFFLTFKCSVSMDISEIM